MRLYRDRFEGLRSLFSGLRTNLVVDSIIDGNTPAWVYADAADSPRSAWMWDRQDAVLFAGTPDPGLVETLREVVLPDAQSRWIPELCLFTSSAEWEEVLREGLPGLRITPAQRLRFCYSGKHPAWRDLLPEGFSLRRMDAYLLHNSDLLNVDQMAGWVSSFWESDDSFFRTGFGYCVIEEDTVVSWCLTVFASTNQRELGLATVPGRRGRGLAAVTATACLEHCDRAGLTPHWHCWADNAPSSAVALHVGFIEPEPYEVLRLRLRD
ncbi:MAG: GNAT family N-acetyltransferase [Anaerolineae bacterium]|nr:GNAT family N-acetyltransferase [Anaerolineae bacterium]